MDTGESTSLRQSQRQPGAMGGTVEPAHRAMTPESLVRTPTGTSAERYELRDPFAEVTYRSNDFAQTATKADQLGSKRFVAIDADGHRITITRVGDQWQRGEIRPPKAEPARDLSHERDDESPPATRARQDPVAPDRLPSGTEAIARIDARTERTARIAQIEAALAERYVIKRAPVTVGDLTIGRTEYRFCGDTSRVAFTESTFRLATDTNSPSVARSMVDVAEARNWRALRLSGSEDFRRMVWLEASVRGVKTRGYEPNPGDLELLRRERDARLVNRIEPARAAESGTPVAADGKSSARGSGGRKTVLAAIEAVLVAKGVSEQRREAILIAAGEKLAKRARDGQVPKVRVYDRAAPSQRRVVVPAPEVQRARERAAPAR